MNRVADKNGMIARRATPVAAATRYCVAADCGSSRLLPFPHRRFAHRVMAAVILRCQGAQHRERPFLSQPIRALALRAVCGVRLRHVTAQQPIAGAAAGNPLPHRTLTRTVSGVLLLAKGITIRVVAFLAMPSRHVTAQQPIAGARAGRPSRTKCYAPPCPACNPAKPNARPCGT
jgi:hypothetical protein